MTKSYDSKIIEDILGKNDPEAVDNEYILEDVILKIQELNISIDELEEKKKEEVNLWDNKINKVQGIVDFLKHVIKLTCDAKNEESFKFEDIGVASKSKGRTNWVVSDKDAMRNYLSDNLTDDEKKEVFVPQPDSIAKKKLDAVLERWESEGNLPDCVDKVTNESTVKIRFAKKKAENKDDLEDIEF